MKDEGNPILACISLLDGHCALGLDVVVLQVDRLQGGVVLQPAPDSHCAQGVEWLNTIRVAISALA